MSTSISCRRAVDYISKREEGRLSAVQRFQLWRHLAVCSLCRLFSRQNAVLTEALRQVPPPPPLSPAQKDALADAVLRQDPGEATH